MRDPVDSITGRAVWYGLEPGVDPQRAVGDLVELARGHGSLLQRAEGRVGMSLGSSTRRAGREVPALPDRAVNAVSAPHTVTGLEAATCGSR
jgi:hypothetical protein